MGSLLRGIAFITGAGGGIGRACVLEFIRSGCTGMLITDVDRDSLSRTISLAKELNTDVPIIAETADLTSKDSASRLIQQAASHFGRLDYALNVAGIPGKLRPIHELAPHDFKEVLAVNAESVWLCEREEISQMLKQTPGSTHDGRPGSKGAIVTVSSICGLVGLPNSTPYSMSKHAILGMVKTDSSTFASQGIRVNAVCPGFIQTPMTSANDGTGDFAKQYVQQFTPMKRLGTAQEIADVVTFLCSSRASYVSGAAFVVDGGHTAQ